LKYRRIGEFATADTRQGQRSGKRRVGRPEVQPGLRDHGLRVVRDRQRRHQRNRARRRRVRLLQQSRRLARFQPVCEAGRLQGPVGMCGRKVRIRRNRLIEGRNPAPV